MNIYIGTKIIEAEPQDAPKESGGYPVGSPGYKVKYAGGYVSWSPKGVFEDAYRPISGMNFGLAIEAMRLHGKKVARQGWNGKDMFIFIREGRMIQEVSLDSPMGGPFESRSHICMKDAQGKCVVGWLASQTDMLADDWVIVD